MKLSDERLFQLSKSHICGNLFATSLFFYDNLVTNLMFFSRLLQVVNHKRSSKRVVNSGHYLALQTQILDGLLIFTCARNYSHSES